MVFPGGQRGQCSHIVYHVEKTRPSIIVLSMDSLISTARVFCAWCKSDPDTESKEAQYALSLLVRLYSQALELDAPMEFDSDIKTDPIDDNQWREIVGRAGALPFNYYSTIFNPLVVPSEEPVVGDLADDIADIYRDLCTGVALFDSGYKAEAQWELYFSFHSHWGRHASSAIAVLHCWRADSHELWNTD